MQDFFDRTDESFNMDVEEWNDLTFFSRVFIARWALLGVVVIFLMFSFEWPKGYPFLLIGFIGLVLIIIYLPFKPLQAKKRLRAERGAIRSIWPDTQSKLFVDGLPEPALVLDGEGVVRHTNAMMREIFGAIPLGDPFTFKFRDPSIVEALEKTQETGLLSKVHFTVKFPSERRFLVHLSPIKMPRAAVSRPDDNKQTPDFIFAMFFDQTERFRVDQLRSDFIANVSHELRTPVAAMTGFIETLQGPAKNDRKAQERFLGIMLEQANRMTRLITDLLSLSSIEMRSHVRPRNVIDLMPIIAHVSEAMQTIAKDAGMDIHIHYEAPESPLVIGDRDELIQVFQNLIENACKYGSDGDRIDIEISTLEKPPFVTQYKTDWICVDVRDNGKGISAEHLPRLTERFYRVDPEESKRKMGTGLGLAVVKHILTRHRGDLKIESEPGKGAVFKVYLPR